MPVGRASEAITRVVAEVQEMAEDQQLLQHCVAWVAPQGVERSIRNLVVFLAEYADQFERRFEQPLGTDAVIGMYWLGMVASLGRLRDGPTGRLDSGLLGQILREVGYCAGFDMKAMQEAVP